jgi:hypothetical protein
LDEIARKCAIFTWWCDSSNTLHFPFSGQLFNGKLNRWIFHIWNMKFSCCYECPKEEWNLKVKRQKLAFLLYIFLVGRSDQHHYVDRNEIPGVDTISSGWNFLSSPYKIFIRMKPDEIFIWPDEMGWNRMKFLYERMKPDEIFVWKDETGWNRMKFFIWKDEMGWNIILEWNRFLYGNNFDVFWPN